MVLVSAVPLAFLCKKLSPDEKKHYDRYFPALLWVLAVLAAAFYTLDITVALGLSFLFLLVFVWWHG